MCCCQSYHFRQLSYLSYIDVFLFTYNVRFVKFLLAGLDDRDSEGVEGFGSGRVVPLGGVSSPQREWVWGGAVPLPRKKSKMVQTDAFWCMFL